MHVSLRRERHVDERVELGPRISGHHLCDVLTHRMTKPRRRVPIEVIELRWRHLGKAGQEADREHEQSVRDAPRLPATLHELIHPERVRSGQLGVMAASPENRTVHHLLEQRPREVAPAQAVADGEQRHEIAQARLGRLAALAFLADELLHALGHLRS